MARSYKQGFFKPLRPEKYVGNPNNIVFRSSWEFKVMSSLDKSDAVEKWSSETVVVPYRDAGTGRARRYFPDFIVKIKLPDGTQKTLMIEVKPAKETVRPTKGKKRQRTFMNEAMTYMTNTSKWAAARDFCDKRGWEFRVVTEDDLGL